MHTTGKDTAVLLMRNDDDVQLGKSLKKPKFKPTKCTCHLILSLDLSSPKDSEDLFEMKPPSVNSDVRCRSKVIRYHDKFTLVIQRLSHAVS
jgi:hypothetical protein